MDESYVPNHLLRVGKSFAQTYKPVLEFDGWIVAMLRHCESVSSATFHRVECHQTSNEIFILTAGSADLIVYDGDSQPTNGFVVPMELNVAYDIPRLVWHWVIMSRDGHIILIERSDTTNDTTDFAELTAVQAVEIAKSLTGIPG